LIRKSNAEQTDIRKHASPSPKAFPPEILVLVTDIGGPVALQEFLLELSPDFSAPLLVLQPRETVFFEANLKALQRTVPFGVQMLERETALEAGKVYVGASEQSYQLISTKPPVTIVSQQTATATWPTGESLRQLGAILRNRLTVVFLTTRFEGFSLEQLCREITEYDVNLLFVRSTPLAESLLKSPKWEASSPAETKIRFELVDSLADLAAFLDAKPDLPGKNQLSQTFRQ